MAGRQVSLFCVVLGVVIGVVRVWCIPPPVNVSSLVNYDHDPFKEYDWCPLINMKGYMQYMAKYVADESPETALIVVGVKDAGKTRGIVTMIDSWKKAGHIVLDIDLKGKPEGISSSEVLKSVAWQLYNTIKGNEFFHLRKYFLDNCSEELYRKSDTYSLIQLIGSAILGALGIWICGKLSNYCDPEMIQYWSLVLIGPGIVALVVFGYIDGAGRVMEVFDPLYDKISSGDWETLRCVCNGISTHYSEVRPILIVRDFATLEDKSRNDLLRSVEKFKQKDVSFPVILETSDFMWLNSSSLIKSSKSFESYYLKEMSFEDGESELVNGYKMWNHDQFAMIYEAIGGHGGSYGDLWFLIKRHEYSIEEAIQYLKHEAYVHLITCIESRPQLTNNAYYRFIWNLRLQKFKYNVADPNSDVPRHVIYHFATCNLVFLDGERIVYPQNRLLIHAITEYLDKYPRLDDPAENSSQVT